MAVRLSMSVSLDGYVAGLEQRADRPLGLGGETLHTWFRHTRTFRVMIGDGAGGTTGLDDDVARETSEGVGAHILGRRMFGGGEGPWDPAWRGWWGDEPPYHAPVFVLTHHPREPLEMLGGTTFHFVTGGAAEALERARAAAGDLDVRIGGGAATARQYLATGLVDRIDLQVSPVLLGAGERLLGDLGEGLPGYRVDAVRPSEAAVHYRLLRAD